MVIHFHHFSSLPGSEISLGKKNKTTGSKSSASGILSRLVLWQTRRWSAPRVFRQDLRPFLSEKKDDPFATVEQFSCSGSKPTTLDRWERIYEYVFTRKRPPNLSFCGLHLSRRFDFIKSARETEKSSIRRRSDWTEGKWMTPCDTRTSRGSRDLVVCDRFTEERSHSHPSL